MKSVCHVNSIEWKYYTAKKIDAEEYLLAWHDASSTVYEKIMHKTYFARVNVKRAPILRSNSRSVAHLLPNLEPQWPPLENGNGSSVNT